MNEDKWENRGGYKNSTESRWAQVGISLCGWLCSLPIPKSNIFPTFSQHPPQAENCGDSLELPGKIPLFFQCHWIKLKELGGKVRKFFGISPAPTSKFMGDIPNPTAFGSHGFLELWELPGNSQSFHIQKFISCRERCLLEWELFRNIQPKPLEFHWELLSQSLLILGLPRLLHGCGIPQKNGI